MTSRRSFTAIELDPEQEQILQLSRDFAEERLRPTAEGRDRDEDIVDEGIHRELGDLGFLAMRVPEQYGGLGLDMLTYLYVIEELAWGDPSVAVSASVHNSLPVAILKRHGSDAQRDEWLPKMASGEVMAAFALSEAGAGSDARAIRTRATPVPEGWRLQGEKMWVTNGGMAGLVITFALSGETEPPGAEPEEAASRQSDSKPIGAFLIPEGIKGVAVGKKEKKMGLRGSETVSLVFDDALLGPEHVVGDPKLGLKYALQALEGGRLGIAAQALGIASAAVDAAFEYADARSQFGRPIRTFQGLQFLLSTMVARLESGRGLLERAARAQAVGDPRSRRLSSLAKWVASEAASLNSRDAVQVFGGYGYSKEYPVERIFRDAKVTEIYEGANEIHRSLVVRQFYRERGYVT